MGLDKLKNCLRLGLLNIRSLNTGQDELSASIFMHKPDILALNETWLKEGQEIIAPVIHDYKYIQRGRKGRRRGGGVGFYIKKGIQVKVKTHPNSELEQLWLELKLPGAKRMALGTAYRPEEVKVPNALDALSDSVSFFSDYDYICLLTDFNVNLLDENTSKAKQLLQFCSHQNLEQVVHEPTRIQDTSSTLLDLIITDIPERCKKITVVHNSSLSDHGMVLAEFNVKKPKPVKRFINTRALQSMNSKEFQRDLSGVSWSKVLDNEHVDDMINTFNIYILRLFNTHAPLKKKLIKATCKPWITDTVLLMMSLRDKTLEKANKTKKESTKEYYKSLKNLVTSTVEREKTAYFQHKINQNINNPKILWNNIKKTTLLDNACKASIPDHLNDPDIINEHFLTLPNSESDQVLVDFFVGSKKTANSFNLKPTTEEEVAKILLGINTNATGHDHINAEMLKLIMPEALPTITKIINKSIESGCYPQSFKTALVTPLPKSSAVDSVKDLRPISILPTISKIFERVVQKQMVAYLHTENIIPDIQSGFRKMHGTETALLKVTDDIIAESDAGNSSVLVLLDFSRAFDCLDPSILLAKLAYYGFSANTCKWFESFLTQRKQIVVTEGANGDKQYSKIGNLSRGVPQGSIISPILFTIFTADIVNIIEHTKCHLYADDTQIYYSFDSNETPQAIEKINSDLDKIYAWAVKNSLVINPSKSKTLILGTKSQIAKVNNSNPRILMQGSEIPIVTNAKNLGLIMDSELRFHKHLGDKIRTAFYKLKVLYSVKKYLSTDLKLLLTDMLVLSPLNYCSAVYGPRLQEKSERAIQRVQNACARFCFKIPKRSYITPYLNQHGILNMKSRRELHMACLTKKIIYRKNPKYLFDKLTWQKDLHSLNTRSKDKNLLAIQKHKTKGYTGCFKYAASKIWNNLPPPLRSKIGLTSFKVKFKIILLSKQKINENLKRPYQIT